MLDANKERYLRNPDSVVEMEKFQGAGWASLHQEDDQQFAIVRHYHHNGKSGELVLRLNKPKKSALEEFKAFVEKTKAEQKRIGRVATGIVRDNQKNRVLSHLTHSPLLKPLAEKERTRPDAVLFFDKISHDYGIKPFSIRMLSDHKHRYASYNHVTHEIVLPTEALNDLAFVQLASYGLNYHWNGEKAKQHGPEFAAILVKLLNKLHGIDVVQMVRNFQEDGIDVSIEELLTDREVKEEPFRNNAA